MITRHKYNIRDRLVIFFGIFLIDFTFFILFSTMGCCCWLTTILPPSHHYTIVQPSHTNTILLIVAAANIRDLRRSSNDQCLLNSRICHPKTDLHPAKANSWPVRISVAKTLYESGRRWLGQNSSVSLVDWRRWENKRIARVTKVRERKLCLIWWEWKIDVCRRWVIAEKQWQGIATYKEGEGKGKEKKNLFSWTV